MKMLLLEIFKLTQHVQITFVYKKNYQYTQNQTINNKNIVGGKIRQIIDFKIQRLS
jgi:hypothetical protein